ncbi:MAG: hypothetical protein QM817_34475 [Archangium sp.]
MIFRIACALAAVLPFAAHADEVTGTLERRLAIHRQLIDATGNSCAFLASLSNQMPESVVLSRVQYSRVPGLFSVELSEGTTAEAEELLGGMVTARLCSSPSAKVEKGVVKGSCVCASSLDKHTVKSSTRLGSGNEDGVISVKKTQLDGTKSLLPETPSVDEAEASMRELASKYGLTELTLVRGAQKTLGPVDAFPIVIHARAESANATGFMCELGFLRRVTSVESVEISNPRVEGDGWNVEFIVTTTTWRYRVEDDTKDLTLETQKSAAAPKQGSVQIGRLRSPFGPAVARAGELLSGPQRALKGTECRNVNSKTLAADAKLETLTVVYGNSKCLMVIDDIGACRVWKRGELGAEGFKFGDLYNGIATVSRVQTGADKGSKPVVREFSVPSTSPPPGFCP